MSTSRRAIRLIALSGISWQLASSTASARAPSEAVSHHVRLLELKGSGDGDDALIEAKRLVSEHADFSLLHRTVADLYIGLDDVAGAREFYQDWLARDPQSAHAFYGLARMDLHEGNLESGVEHLKRSIALAPGFAEPFGLRGGLVEAYELSQSLDVAVDYFLDLTLSSPEAANAFAGLGWSYARSFQFDQAIRAFERSVELEPELVQAHHGLVHSFFRTGRYQSSLMSCRALKVAAQSSGDLEMVAYAAMVQGTTVWIQGDYRAALSQLQASQQLAKEIGDTAREASAVNNIAAVYATAGEFDRALPYFETSLEMAKHTANSQTEVNALINIGSVHRDSGRLQEALASFREAVTLANESGYQNQHCEALANMAEALHLDGRLDEARRRYQEALRIAEAIQNRTIEAFVVGMLGSLSRDRAEYEEAIGYFERGLALGEQTGDVQAIWEAQAGLGSTYEKRGDVDSAITHYARAIQQYDAVRESLAIESMGDSFLEDKYEAYPSIVELLAQQGSLGEAFVYTEKYKAKGFLDIIARGQTLFETHLPEELRRDLERLQTELQDSYAERARVSSLALEERITALELRKASLVDRVRSEYGDFYQLALSEPLDVEAIQRDVLESDQVLIEYLIGDETLSIFVADRDHHRYRAVPIEREELRQQLERLSPLFASEGPRTSLLNAELADFSLPPARALYESLIAPVEAWLPENAELIIVPDDFLFYLPFELLVAESDDAAHRYDFSAATFLIEQHAVSYSSSASLLDPGLRRARTFTKGVLAFGNPSVGVESAAMPPLPNAEAEVVAIREAFGDLDNGVFTGERATKDVFRKQSSDYGVLHFATHFLSDDRQPLYSSIALAEEEVLQTYELFDADLNAELAVLSACNTGLGKLAKGQGLIGITRAFLYAGVPSLVVSLWSVEDRATSHIMQRFYEHLRAGASRNQALRSAKLDYLSEASGEQKDPFYWAPFILNGEWRPLALPAAPTDRRPRALLALGVLLALAGLLAWRRRGAAG